MSKELGLVKGWDEFDSVLTFHREHAPRGDDERAAGSMAAADELHAVVRTLAAAALRAFAAAAWQEHAGLFLELLTQFLPAAADSRAMATIADRVRKLAVLDRAATRGGSVAATPERFRQAAEARHQFHQRAPSVELSARGGWRPGRRFPLRRSPRAERGALVPADAGAKRLRRRCRRGCAPSAR